MNPHHGKTQCRISAGDWRLIDNLLQEEWSPEHISLWLSEAGRLSISHEWIYQHIIQDKRCGGTLNRHLRCQKQRKKRHGSYEQRGQILNKVHIDECSAIVERRQRIGDWELDTIIGKGHKPAIVSLSEQKSRLLLIAKVEHQRC